MVRHGVTFSIPVCLRSPAKRCDLCGALVDALHQDVHADFHARVDGTFLEKMNEGVPARALWPVWMEEENP